MNQPIDPEYQEIEALMAADDFRALGQKIQKLMRMPQSMCKVRGNCCRIATFTGSLSYKDLQALLESPVEKDAERAKDFLTLFIPYETQDEVRAMAPEFVDRIRDNAETNPDEIAFFKCRFLGERGECLIHEDRPTGCRVYPFPHEKTIYHPGCGFETLGKANLKKVNIIREFFDRRLAEIKAEEQLWQSVQSATKEEPPEEAR